MAQLKLRQIKGGIRQGAKVPDGETDVRTVTGKGILEDMFNLRCAKGHRIFAENPDSRAGQKCQTLVPAKEGKKRGNPCTAKLSKI